jgi:hypothetical protein
MKSHWHLLLALHLAAASVMAAGAGGVFNVRDFGAKGDGQALDTAAIQQAVDACATAGGGQVLIPPGRFLSGTVRLKSHITLRLDAGATLLGSTNLSLYSGFMRTNLTPRLHISRWHRGLLVAEDAEDIAIVGPGTIDGNKIYDPTGEERMRGPHTVLFGHCRGFTLREVNITDSGNYAVLFFFSDRVDVRQVKITGGWDGVHFRGSPERGCRDINIIGCQFYTGDDSIAGSYWERTVIRDCVINSSCNGIRLIGPATSLIVSDCLFYGPGAQPHRSSARTNMLAGVCLQPSGWDAMPGLLDDVLLANLTMRNVTTPFHIVTKKGNPAGSIHVERVSATGVYRTAASVESWGDTPITNVVFRDISIEYAGGGKPAANPAPVRPPGVDARPLPAWGFYARQVGRLELDHVRLRCTQEDTRPVLQCEQVRQLDLDHLQFRHAEGATQTAILTEVGLVRLRQSDLEAEEIKGTKTQAWK